MLESMATTARGGCSVRQSEGIELSTPRPESEEFEESWIIGLTGSGSFRPTIRSEELKESWIIGLAASRVQSHKGAVDQQWGGSRRASHPGPVFRLRPLPETLSKPINVPASEPTELEKVWQKVAEEALALPFSMVADYLELHLGPRLTAFLAHQDDHEAVRRWIGHEEVPEKLSQERLRRAFQAARLLVDAYGDEAARSWFFARNSYLDGQAPAAVLRDNRDVEQFDLIILAVHFFVERDAV